MRSDWVISGSLHAALFAAFLVTIASSKPAANPSDFVPVSIVTDSNLSQAALGQQNAPKPAVTKPLADKIGDTKPVKELAPKVVDKPDITTKATPPPSPPQPKPAPEVKPAEKHETKTVTAEHKPAPKQGEKPAKKPVDFKPDQIADLLNKHDAEKPPKTRDQETQKPPKYDANQIAELLDRRDPQRQTATGRTLNNTPNLGAPTAPADAQLSQDEIDALRERIRECWSPPPGVDTASNISVSLRVMFRPDGYLAQPPALVAGTPSPLGPALAESGKRALLLCQPFKMLKPEHYAQWKDITVDFDPRELSSN